MTAFGRFQGLICFFLVSLSMSSQYVTIPSSPQGIPFGSANGTILMELAYDPLCFNHNIQATIPKNSIRMYFGSFKTNYLKIWNQKLVSTCCCKSCRIIPRRLKWFKDFYLFKIKRVRIWPFHLFGTFSIISTIGVSTQWKESPLISIWKSLHKKLRNWQVSQEALLNPN